MLKNINCFNTTSFTVITKTRSTKKPAFGPMGRCLTSYQLHTVCIWMILTKSLKCLSVLRQLLTLTKLCCVKLFNWQSSSITAASQRNVIAQAMNDYHLYTCIRFVARTTEANYLIIDKTGTGYEVLALNSSSAPLVSLLFRCNCHVGMIGGGQTVSLDDGCVGSKTTPIHEFMHAVGFWHEQTRYDRDDYVTIYWDNIIPGRRYMRSILSAGTSHDNFI